MCRMLTIQKLIMKRVEISLHTSLAGVYNANISIQNGIQQTLTMMVDQRSGHTYIIYIKSRHLTN